MSKDKDDLKWEDVLQVHILEAKPNPMFTEAQRETVRFLRYSHAVECAECGRRSKNHWTSLMSFKAMDMRGNSFTLRSATDKVHPPLTPVCSAHLMTPAAMPPLPPRKRKRKSVRAMDVSRETIP